jgi:hypothetical protein
VPRSTGDCTDGRRNVAAAGVKPTCGVTVNGYYKRYPAVAPCKRSSKRPPDALKIFRHAEKFYWVLGHLWQGDNADHIDKIAHPATTIGAFTSELYLKCLLVFLSGKLKGHTTFGSCLTKSIL